MSSASVVRAACLALCAGIAFVSSDAIRWIEAGGSLPSSLVVQCCLFGSLAFVAGALLALMSSGLSGLVAIVAALMCVPLYVLLVAPRSLDMLSSPSSFAVSDLFVWNAWAIGGLLSLILLAFVLQMTKLSDLRR